MEHPPGLTDRQKELRAMVDRRRGHERGNLKGLQAALTAAQRFAIDSGEIRRPQDDPFSPEFVDPLAHLPLPDDRADRDMIDPAEIGNHVSTEDEPSDAEDVDGEIADTAAEEDKEEEDEEEEDDDDEYKPPDDSESEENDFEEDLKPAAKRRKTRTDDNDSDSDITTLCDEVARAPKKDDLWDDDEDDEEATDDVEMERKIAKKSRGNRKRPANSNPVKPRQQMDADVRGKIASLRPLIETVKRMSLPFARTDAYDSDEDHDDATLARVNTENAFPWVINAVTCYREQIPNEDGSNQNGLFLAKPEMHFHVGSERAAQKLKKVLKKGKMPITIHTDYDDYMNSFKSESGKNKEVKK